MSSRLSIISVERVDGAVVVTLSDESFMVLTLDQLIRAGVPRMRPQAADEDFERALRQAVEESRKAAPKLRN